MSADFWAGYISGVAGIIVGNPLDLIKTQLQNANHSAPTTTFGIVDYKNVFVYAGVLVRGATAPALGYGLLNAVLFLTYNRTLAFLAAGSADLRYESMYLAGMCGGLASFVVSAPTELIKVRAQLASSNVESSSIFIVREIWKTNGFRGFYQGAAITAWRDSIGYGFYVDAVGPWEILLAGGIAGCISWSSIFPLDVIKTRMQSQRALEECASFAPLSSSLTTPTPLTSPTFCVEPSLQHAIRPFANSVSRGNIEQASEMLVLTPPRKDVSRSSIMALTMQMYRTDGLGAFFRGIGICNVRAFIVNAVQWTVYEWMITLLHSK